MYRLFFVDFLLDCFLARFVLRAGFLFPPDLGRRDTPPFFDGGGEPSGVLGLLCADTLPFFGGGGGGSSSGGGEPSGVLGLLRRDTLLFCDDLDLERDLDGFNLEYSSRYSPNNNWIFSSIFTNKQLDSGCPFKGFLYIP